MTTGRVGDRVIEESERIGSHGREGEVLEVLGEGANLHYRIRWEDGRETVLFPSSGNITFIHPAGAAKRS